MTIVVSVEDTPLEQITKQLNKLINVIKIVEQEDDNSVSREIALIKVRADAGTGGTVTFAASGRSVRADGATTLLEAGERAGVLPPFGCRMGICHTCVVNLVDGRVRDLRTGAEYEPGSRVQTCVTAPAGDCVVDI